MNKKQAADYLGVSLRAVERYTAKGRLSARYQRDAKGDEAVYDERELKQLRAETERKRGQVRPAVSVETFDTSDTQALILSGVSGNGLAPVDVLRQVIAAAIQETIKASAPPVSLADKLLLTLPDAAGLTGLSRGHLLASIRAGKLRAKIVGRAWRIKRPDLDAYIKKL